MYELTVIETNEIAGEVVKSRVWVSRHRTLTKARAEAERRWHGQPPQGAAIRHTDGTLYDIPQYDAPRGKPLIDIL